jgi:hypothetical protein
MSLPRLSSRVTRLEAQAKDHGYMPRCVLVWDDAPLPADIREHDCVVRLVHKAASAEEWERRCRDRDDSGSLPRDAGDPR